jgi:hypothetical protein
VSHIVARNATDDREGDLLRALDRGVRQNILFRKGILTPTELRLKRKRSVPVGPTTRTAMGARVMTDDRPWTVAIFAALVVLLSASVESAEAVEINEIVVAASIPDPQRDATVEAARAFYDFWNTGNEIQLKHAIADTFIDRTLPAGRPQGPEGPVFASRQFRGAVPHSSPHFLK